MPRPNQTDQQRKKLLPIVCQVFSELGYRRATTAELAARCGVRENILYRLWPDKKAIFVAAIDDLFHRRGEVWADLIARQPDPEQATKRLVAYEARHQGEFGFYRVVFTALAETDDPEIRDALVRMYRGFHDLVKRQVEVGRGKGTRKLSALPADAAAWALIGLATVSNISRLLELLTPRKREQVFAAIAEYLVEGAGR
ncbi:MAG: TetR/AcrR family transcriptional regulator [Pirellulales bacterium]